MDNDNKTDAPKQLTVAVPPDLVPYIMAKKDSVERELGITLNISQIVHSFIRKGMEL